MARVGIKRRIEQEIQTYLYSETGKLSGKERENVRVKELPGSSPAMLPWLINRTVFVSLRDLGYALPKEAHPHHRRDVTRDGSAV